MKKQTTLAGFLILSGMMNAQFFTPSGAGPSTTVYRDGRTGFGMTAAPSTYKVEVEVTAPDDGIQISQKTTAGTVGSAALYLNNATGHKWGLHSTGTNNNVGPSHFTIYDITLSENRLFISGDNSNSSHPGNVGIGTNGPGYAKFSVLNINPLVNVGLPQTKWAIRGVIEPQEHKISDGFHESEIGVEGHATTPFVGENIMYGVVGRGHNGLNNYGGYFEALQGNSQYVGAANFGVRATANGNYRSYGIYAEASGGSMNNYAGWFQGDVVRTGSDNFSSDRKLKNDIKPLENALETLMKLKPSTYTFKTEEYKTMNLPKGKQMGLIAQELELVLPELVSDMPEMIEYDKDGNKKVITPEFKAVQYIALIPLLIRGIQEQKKEIDEQKALIGELTGKNGNATSINQISGDAQGFALEQNIPNPFTQETEIRYSLPSQVKEASLLVYDLSGKQIAAFPITEKGASSIKITSEKLAAGIYIYSIMADGKIMDSKRMVVAQK